MDLKILTSAIMEIAEEKGISQEKVKEIIEIALATAYKKEYGAKGEKYETNFNPKTGEINFWQIKQVVLKEQIFSKEETDKIKKTGEETLEDKIYFNPERHILLEEAKKIEPQITAGEFLKILAEKKQEFGRIAAQTAKQVILQKIKEAEKEVILKEYQEKQGELVSGIVQRVESSAVFFDIGKISGILAKTEQIPGEFYQIGKRLKLYLLKIEDEQKNPLIFVSRAYPKLVSKLFELEVPEISTGQVNINQLPESRDRGQKSLSIPRKKILILLARWLVSVEQE